MFYLCSNSSCHASSLNAYHGRTSCFYRVYVTSNNGSMQYTKQAIDFSDQLTLLKQRGLIIDDEDKALRCLHSISYFRLTSYLVPMESDSDTHAFRPNSHLHTAIALYNFDRKLRSLVFTSIQDIEVALRTRIIHYFSLAHGPFWFMRNDLFINESIHQTCINNIASEVNRSKEEFISEYRRNYTSPEFPPAWKTLEVVSFGTLSKLFCNFKNVKVKKQVARDFNLPQYTYLESWIKCAVVLRNACAHHARIWNKRFPTMPTMPQRLPESWVSTNSFRPNKLYHQLCYLAYMEQSIVPNSDFTEALVKLVKDNPDIQTRSMGFPLGNWQDEPLWSTQS